MSKVLDLARKLHAIATKGGSEGERQTASQMLERFLILHGLEMTDIEGEKKSWRKFYTPRKVESGYKLWKQIVAHVCGPRKDIYRVKGRASYSQIEVTDAQFAEIDIKYDFYSKHYEEEQRIFYSAFIQKNRLWRESTPEELEAQKNKILTPEEEEELERMLEMMAGIKRASPTKQLENKK